MTEAADKSRILTLVFTDLADSTALKMEKGDQAVRELIRRHRELVARLTDDCSGRVIDWAGDGCFLTFETSSAAVLFALRLQQAHAEEPDLPCVRIGVHMGEVSESPGPDGGKPRIEGLAVDLAARVSALAKPGQVLMSAAVYDSARQRLGVDAFGQPVLWQTHGAYTLKGFDKPLEIGEAGFEGLSPLCAPEATEKARPSADRAEASSDRRDFISRGPARAWLLSAGIVIAIVAVLASVLVFDVFAPTREPDTPSVTDTIGPIISLAVLPLDSLSDDPEQEYFAEGMTEAIISELAKIKSLKVISRTSIVRYKDTDLSMPEIAAELGVDGLIEGSVLRDGDEVRITAQLIHGPSDTHLWAETYTNIITSVMQLQSDVALAIADAIDAEVTGDEHRRISAARKVNPEAYDAYIIGTHYLDDISKEGLFTSIEYFEKAVEIDPDYSYAWGGIVCASWELAAAGLARPREIYPKARAAGIRALQLNDDQSTDQSHLGMISMGYDYEWEQAEERFLHAVELSPSNSVPHGDYAQFLVVVGRAGEALQHAATSLDLDPKPAVFSVYLVLESMYLESNPQRVRRSLERLLAEEPGYVRTLEALTLANKYLAMPDAAIATAERWVEEAGRDASTLTNLALALADHDQSRRAREILEEVAAIEDYFDSTGVGYAYVSLDDLDAAFQWLEKGYDSRDWGITRLRTMPYWKIYLEDPSWIRFRNDPRYRDLIARVGFPALPPEHAGYADEQAWKAQDAAAEAADAPIKKIAVLPFANFSGDEDQAYFVDGMTDALISELAKVKSIRVISRTSTIRYKDTDKPLTEIARELDVDALVEGSVFRSGNNVRITAQLINGRTDEHIWSDSYTDTLDNVFQLQGELALTIAGEISASLTPAEKVRIADRTEIDPDAYDAYLRGRHLWVRRTRADMLRAIEYFEDAVRISPDFAMAYAASADAYALLAAYAYLPPAETYAKAIEVANKALEIDPELAEAYVSLGYARGIGNLEIEQAYNDFERGIELNPNYEQGYSWYASLLVFEGEIDHARQLMETARILDPLSPLMHAVTTQILIFERSFDEAIRTASRFLEIEPDAIPVLWWRGVAELAAERPEAAAETFTHLVNITNRRTLFLGFLGMAYARLGERDQALALVREIQEAHASDAAKAYDMAKIYFGLGELDETYGRLDASLEEYGLSTLGLHSSPLWDPLRDDPRFQDLLRRMNFTER